MNTPDLRRPGVFAGEPLRLAHEFSKVFIAQGSEGPQFHEPLPAT